MFGKMIRLSEFRSSDFKCKDLKPLCFHLQMLRDRILNNSETCLKHKYQLQQITITRGKMFQLIQSAFFEKWV